MRARREGETPIHQDLLEYVSSHGGTRHSTVEEGGIRYRWMMGNWERSVRKRGQRGRPRQGEEGGRREGGRGGRESEHRGKARKDGEGRMVKGGVKRRPKERGRPNEGEGGSKRGRKVRERGRQHSLADYAPGLVGVSIVADYPEEPLAAGKRALRR